MTQQKTRTDFITENAFIAGKLNDVADLLEQQVAAPFRARAYREAATTLAALPQPIRRIYETEGRNGLQQLPTIGVSISAAVAALLDSGAFDVLDRFSGSARHQTQDMCARTCAMAVGYNNSISSAS